MSDILTTLNERQFDAATSTEGYLRVIAGAGSGKTKLLVSRYAYLVQEYGISPSNILCVTFTNKAAGEMKRRVRALIGGEYDTSLISTYHGFCVRVLREDIEKVFYPKEFTIIDKPQQKSILGEIYRKFELKLDHASFEKILDEIALYKAANRDYVAKMCARGDIPIMDAPAASQNGRIIEEYMRRQKQLYAMDFSDLLYFTLDIFARCPDVLAKWQDRINYIQVDEFQDSSRVEMELVDLVSAKYKNLMIVGDPDQNIYEWRGSDVRLLVDFDKTHVPTKTVILDRNYRSTPEILKCANTLIEKNVNRLKKDLYTLSGSGSPVIHYHARSEFEEADRVVENIEAIRREKNCSYRDFAVLYRSGFLSRVVEKKLTENAIPYEIFGGVKFYQRMEIQDVAAYLRLIALDDNDAFRRIVNTPRRRFGRSRLAHLVDLANASTDGSLFNTLKSNVDDPVFAGSGAADFVALIDRMRAFYPSARISETVERVLADSGYESYIRELGDMERFDNLSEFKRIAGEYEKSFGEDLALVEFISQTASQAADSDDEEGGSDTVKLMTIHSAKGLEFPYVFVVGLSEGIFPSSKTTEERKLLGLEEERRLCYVAITRAKERLFLLDSEGTSGNGRTKLPSRFLFEMGEENYTRIGAIPKELRESSDRVSSGIDAEGIAAFVTGGAVTHPAFGQGVVVSANEKKRTVRVMFEKLGQTRDISIDFFERARAAASKREQSERGAEQRERQSAPSNASSVLRMLLDNVEESERRAEKEKRDALAQEEAETARRAEILRQLTDAGLRRTASPADERAAAPEAAEVTEAAEVAEIAADTAVSIETEREVGAFDEAFGDALPDGQEFAFDDEFEKEDAASADIVDKDDAAGSVVPLFDELPGIFDSRTSSAATSSGATSSVKMSSAAASSSAASSAGAELSATSNSAAPGSSASTKKRPDTRDTANLWDDPAVPKTGWVCTGVTDLGSPSGVCEMCGHQIIRYVHHMKHPNYRQLGVGCICAGKMEGDIDRARRREADFKNREARRKTFLSSKWKVSRSGNQYMKIRGHIIVLIEDAARHGWRCSFDSEFSPTLFPTREDAVNNAFERLERV